VESHGTRRPTPEERRASGRRPFEEAPADFAEAYADLTEADHAELVAAVESGAVTTEREV
jgi:hypothetical protein